MKGWIEVHDSTGSIWVNVAAIEFYRNALPQTKGMKTVIAFRGGEDDYIEVVESPAEIMRLIEEAEK